MAKNSDFRKYNYKVHNEIHEGINKNF